MGSVQSYLSAESAVTLLVVAGAVGYGYTQLRHPESPPAASNIPQPTQDAKKKKKKQAKSANEPKSSTASTSQTPVADTQVVALPEAIPGQFEASSEPTELAQSQTSTTSKAKKTKKKKAQHDVVGATTPQRQPSEQPPSSPELTVVPQLNKERRSPKPKSSSEKVGPSLLQSSTSVDTDGSWTRVEPRRRERGGDAGSTGEDHPASAEATTSDAGITPSGTGNSSPVAERTEDEDAFSPSPNPRDSSENRRTLAQKLAPKARKTGVEDLLETPDYPTLSRVMRIKPGPDDKPASGFSWGDYEDVRVADGGENDADGEDDGWGVVKSKKPKPERSTASPSQPQEQKDPEGLSKRQRQNAQKREAQKAAKSAAEEERLALLARHKRELERTRAVEQQQAKKTSGKLVSGGMKATVDERGRLFWE